jgi:hypothetical protein
LVRFHAPAYLDSVPEPTFSEPDPVSANKYRNGSRNGGFLFVFIARYKGIDEGTMETKTYYGQIKEIWELDYDGDLQMPIFRC